MILKEKVFVVTGAASGIGKEITLALLNKGAKVAAVDIHEDALNDLVKSAGEKRVFLSTHIVNISDREAVEKLPQEVIAKQGQVDGVINNAGIIQPFVRVNDIDFDAVDRVMKVNFYGTLYMVKAFLPILLKRPEGYVANVSSMGGFLPVPAQSIYGASKAAVKLLTEGLYAELLSTSVHVSVIFPGATNTNITKNSGVKGPKMPDSDNKKPNIPMLSAQQAAALIIKGIEKNKPRIFLGKDSNLMNFLYGLSPVFATKLIAKQMKSILPD